jgi:toxin ParE1/3/4
VTRIVWSPRSISDLEAIRDFIAQDSPGYADLTVGRIVSAVDRLADFPLLGRTVPELRQATIREVIVGAYRVVYRARSGTVEVATVFRASRLFPPLT